MPILIQLFSLIVLFGISIGFFLAGYWNTKYLLTIKDVQKKGLRIQLIISQTLASLTYFVVLYLAFTDNPMEYSLFAGIIIRPVLCYVAFTQAAIARNKYITSIKDISAIKNITETLEKIK